MRFELMNPPAAAPDAAAVRRIFVNETRWRVLIETWRAGGVWTGRLVFQPEDGKQTAFGPRLGPPVLHGRTREEVVAQAHEIPERRLHVVLRSLV